MIRTILKNNNNKIIKAFVFTYILSALLEKLRWDIFGWGCDLFTMATAIVFVLLCGTYVIHKKRFSPGRFEKIVMVYYGLLFLYTLLQILVVDNDPVIRIQHLKGIITTFVTVLVALNVIMIFDLYGKVINFMTVSRFLLYAAFLNAVYCIVQRIYPEADAFFVRLFASDTPRYGLDPYGAIGRLTGLFIESNFNGPFMVMGIMNCEFLLQNKSYCAARSQKIFVIVTLILSVFTCLFTFSLTTYLGIGIFVIYLLLKSEPRLRKFIFMIVSMVGICIVAIYFIFPSVRNIINAKFQVFSSLEALTSSSHVVIAVEALSIFSMSFRNILFGTGINCLNVFYQNVFHYEIMKAHNYYLQVLCELGIVGFLLSAFYFFAIFRVACNKSKEGKYLIALLAIMLAMNFTYDPFTRNMNIIFLMFAVALSKNENCSTSSWPSLPEYKKMTGWIRFLYERTGLNKVIRR